MRKFSWILVLALLGHMPPAAAGGFVPGIEDLPLMAGLRPGAGGPLVFDTPAGRIVESPLAGDVNPDRVLEFYREVLPQLGWRLLSGRAFQREGERLRIEFPTRPGAGFAVRFTLRPAGAGGE